MALVLAAIGCESKDKTGTASAEPKTVAAAPAAAPAPVPPTPTAPAVEPAPEIVDVTAKQLFADYDANEIAADGKYKGKVLRISGTVGKVGKDVLDEPYVTLAAGAFDVQCMFRDSAPLAAVKKRQRLTVQCTDPGKMGNVIVRGCAVVPAEPAPAQPPKRVATSGDRDTYAKKLAERSGQGARVDGLVLVLSGGERCDPLFDSVLDTQMQQLRGLGFKEVRCEDTKTTVYVH